MGALPVGDIVDDDVGWSEEEEGAVAVLVLVLLVWVEGGAPAAERERASRRLEVASLDGYCDCCWPCWFCCAVGLLEGDGVDEDCWNCCAKCCARSRWFGMWLWAVSAPLL